MIEKKTTPKTPPVSTSIPPSASRRAQTTAPVQPFNKSTYFAKENYIWMLAGLAVIALGMLLMIGGKSSDPNVFDQKEVYSTRRITIAPLLIVIGLALEVYAIFKKPKNIV